MRHVHDGSNTDSRHIKLYLYVWWYQEPSPCLLNRHHQSCVRTIFLTTIPGWDFCPCWSCTISIKALVLCQVDWMQFFWKGRQEPTDSVPVSSEGHGSKLMQITLPQMFEERQVNLGHHGGMGEKFHASKLLLVFHNFITIQYNYSLKYIFHIFI